jgi:hypothetical protein
MYFSYFDFITFIVSMSMSFHVIIPNDVSLFTEMCHFPHNKMCYFTIVQCLWFLMRQMYIFCINKMCFFTTIQFTCIEKNKYINLLILSVLNAPFCLYWNELFISQHFSAFDFVCVKCTILLVMKCILSQQFNIFFILSALITHFCL